MEKEKAEKSTIKVKTLEEEEAHNHLQKLGYKKKTVIKEDNNTKHPPCTFFTTSYNPKGEKVTKPSLQTQTLTSKLHRDNWGRF